MSEMRNVLERLGLTIYIAGCVLGALCLLIGVGLAFTQSSTGHQLAFVMMGLVAGALAWLIGLAGRYVLTGQTTRLGAGTHQSNSWPQR